MNILNLTLLAWIIFPIVVALFNLVTIGTMHLAKSDNKSNYQPLKLIFFDFTFAFISTTSSIGCAFLLRFYTDTTEVIALFVAAILAVTTVLFYVIKLRDSIWYELIETSGISNQNTLLKVASLPKIFHFLIPSVNNGISIYIANNGIIVDNNFYNEASDTLKRYISYLAEAFNKSAISTRLFTYMFVSQVGFMVVLILSNWISDSISVNTVIANGFTTTELLIIAAFLVSSVATAYSFFMISSLYKWQWKFVEQNLASIFSEAEIKQIQEEIDLRDVKVNGYYNIFKRHGYTPKPT